MNNIYETVTKFNDSVNGFVWGVPMLVLLVGTGIIMTIVTKWFQISHIGHWFSKTIGSVFKKGSSAMDKSDKNSISQFQSLCTALAATVGTGNIAGVATAIVSGGPGAVFWMWFAAFFGMMTNYSENVLGIYFRRRNIKGDWCGGAMYYLEDGLGGKKNMKTVGKILAVLFSIFAVLASFGIGNLAQVNTISANLNLVFSVNPYITGAVLVTLVALIIIGGLKRIASVTERLVPFMVVIYILGTLTIFCIHITKIGAIFGAIFKFAFGFKALAGGAVGIAVKQAITMGFKRGVFSNEAGLGSSVMVHSSSNVKEPVVQGMWGVFEVFADTIIVCTLTAFAILSSGLVDLEAGTLTTDIASGTLVASVFQNTFGQIGAYFVATAIFMFAFSTVLGWSYYGTKAWEYLFGTKSTVAYKIVFTAIVFVSAIIPDTYAKLPWDISDTFNGLMAIPNLIGVLSLSGVVYKITKNYIDRRIKNKQTEPLLSYFPDIQQEAKTAIEDGED
ncbi:MAG: alanine:cation symporter family protein [Clostridia bacterium]|nr:alanine:cation symporter family protein [Clostridia bacterium]